MIARPLRCPRHTLFAFTGLAIFYLVIPEPPSSPLFPYTTLFRSDVVVVGAGGAGLRAVVGCSEAGLKTAADHGAQADRKSTRLNSSHLGISYAVFCLKKKKARRQGQSCTSEH